MDEPNTSLSITWEQASDPVTGATYYWNRETRETRWDNPYTSTRILSLLMEGMTPRDPQTFLDRLESATRDAPYPEDIDEEIAYILALMGHEVGVGIEAMEARVQRGRSRFGRELAVRPVVLLASLPKPIDFISKEKYTTFTSRRFKKADVLKGFHQENCVICTEKFKSNQKIPILPCRHDFHWKCLGKWVTNQKKTCPICKANVC